MESWVGTTKLVSYCSYNEPTHF